MATKTLQELQAEQAAIDASYSAAAEKWADGEFDPTDVVTLLERAEAAESNAENSANAASTSAIQAANSAETAATAGAEAGTTAGTAAGTTAGTTAAQSVYDTVFNQEHTYTDIQNFSAITIEGEGPIAKEQAAWLMQNAPAGDYKADSYFTNLWADKQTDDIYIRSLYTFAFNQDPAISPISDSLPEKVTLTLKSGATRVYDNALYKLFNTTANGDQYVSKIANTDASYCFDPVLEHTLLGFWERCNYYKDENGDARIVAVRGEEGFDKRKPDVGTFGPTIWFDVRNSLDVDPSGNPTRTYVIVSTSPHPELGLHPHPLAMRHDGTVAPYWCCSAYPASLSSTGELVSVYNGYPELSTNGGYSASNISAQEICDKCRQKSGKGYGDGSYIASLLQLIHIIKYGTKNSQYVLPGACNSIYGRTIPTLETTSPGAQALGYDATIGAHWVPVEKTESNKDTLAKCNTVWVTGTGTGIYTAPTSDNTKPYMITHIDVESDGLRVWLETDYSIILTSGSSLRAAKSTAGCTDNVYSKYDGTAMYSACVAMLSGSASRGYSYQPFRLHGIEYGLQWEIFTDKMWESPNVTEDMQENGTQGYYRLPWENKYTDATSSPVHGTTERFVQYAYGTDYSTKVIASNYANSGYDIVISTPVCTEKTGSSSTGLCDRYAGPYPGDLQTAGGYGGPLHGTDAGLFYCGCSYPNSTHTWNVGIHL